MKFAATLQLHGKTATGVEVPPEVVEALGSGKRPAVRMTVNGHTWPNTVAVMGGVSLLGISAEHRTAAKVAAGELIEVEVVLDDAPRQLAIPADLAEALAADPVAKAAFDKLSYSNKRRHTLSIEGAKAADTRRRRIDKTIAELRS